MIFLHSKIQRSFALLLVLSAAMPAWSQSQSQKAQTSNRASSAATSSATSTDSKKASASESGPQSLRLKLGEDYTAQLQPPKELRLLHQAARGATSSASAAPNCASLSAQATKAVKSLEGWIRVLEVECELRLLQEGGGETSSQAASKKSADRRLSEAYSRLQKLARTLDTRAELLSWGPWVSTLRAQQVKLWLSLLELDQKYDRQKVWDRVARLSLMNDSLEARDRARIWRIAGEVAFLTQKTSAAVEFFRRSLNEQDQADLRDRLRQVSPQSFASEVSALPNASGVLATRAEDAPGEELEIYERHNSALKRGDVVAAGEDAVKLINKFPGSSRAKAVSQKLFDNLVSAAEKALSGQERFQPIREALLKQMEKAESDHLANWGRLAFNRGLWSEAARMLDRAAREMGAASRATKTLVLALEAQYAVGNWKAVREIAEILIEQHGGTPESQEAVYRSGLAFYRQGEYSRAVMAFERYLAISAGEALTGANSLRIPGLYWYWRSLQKIEGKADFARQVALDLAALAPFSYYGLRARLETDGQLPWIVSSASASGAQAAPVNAANTKPNVEMTLWLTREEKLAWERAMVLISTGLFDEAQAELKLLPSPQDSESRAIHATLWAAARNYLLASRLANQAWDARPELRREELIRAAWPDEFKSVFESEAKAKGLDPHLTRSLTKQESGFFTKAVSSSGALGLMQMIPPTAREIADDLRLGKLSLPEDLFQPERNIKMGTHYVHKMLQSFRGHVPLALAAYNAGPTRVERWLKARAALQQLADSRSSAPENEIWMDEFPYSETSFYVKAILRNVILFRWIESGQVVSSEPLWRGLSERSDRTPAQATEASPTSASALKSAKRGRKAKPVAAIETAVENGQEAGKAD
ncbi:MAG TPA: transglycosylase SLT domain-containing protein [Pseudobdellovibrionaceae bacterium]|nr:transglycosylase SLT domain-containing protein [Pseudobdellovibrionaceae bacterium]